MEYYRPIAMTDPARPVGAHWLAGGWCWFDRVEVLSRTAPPRLMSANAIPPELLARMTMPRAAFSGVTLDRPRLMAILNVTPDSFSDGGKYLQTDAAVSHGAAMARTAEFLDIGGESTRPGATEVPVNEEIVRTIPVIEGLIDRGVRAPISIDTRKSLVAAAALRAGANIINDVSALSFDPALAALVARSARPVVLMHSQGQPATMQDAPSYDDTLLDVYDALAASLARAEAAGIDRARIVLDPGIGFGKTQEHNIALLKRLSLFHTLGCALLIGTSRKRFIGAIGRAERAEQRMPGSVATALSAVAQGAQVVRMHDVVETRQALRLWQAQHTNHLEGQG